MKTVAITSTILLFLLASCDKDANYDAVYLFVKAEPGGEKIDSLKVKFKKKTAGGNVILPKNPDDPGYAFSVPDILDISSDEYILKINTGGEFAGETAVFIAGLSNKKVVASALKIINLSETDRFDLLLKYLKTECDGDGDGVPSCAEPACCAEMPDEGDCDDANAGAHPFLYEDSCTMCSNGA
ncbi:MAG: hypothetical protein FJ088_11145, partial [Deltaproteobacteria bacterium]|nr:hypothetical protein [Deltaproteobacteria bacterium]